MPSPDIERFAVVIADNVVTAFEHDRDGLLLIRGQGRETLISAMVRHLLAVLPTTSGSALAGACNRGLDDMVGAMGLSGPWVEAVDPGDGSVAMRPAGA